MNHLECDDRGVIECCASCGQANRLRYERINLRPRCSKCQSELPPAGQPIEIPDDVSFSALVTRSALPVLVDFWAPWCGPCKMVAPELAKVAADLAGLLLVAKLNTESLPGPAQQFRVSAIPLMVVFKGGREQARQAGAMPARGIAQFVQPHL